MDISPSKSEKTIFTNQLKSNDACLTASLIQSENTHLLLHIDSGPLLRNSSTVGVLSKQIQIMQCCFNTQKKSIYIYIYIYYASNMLARSHCEFIHPGSHMAVMGLLNLTAVSVSLSLFAIVSTPLCTHPQLPRRRCGDIPKHIIHYGRVLHLQHEVWNL